MTPAQIRRRKNTIEKHQQKWADEEYKLTESCTHPNATKKHCGDTGNYDPSADSYWIEFNCSDCGKRWLEDQ